MKQEDWTRFKTKGPTQEDLPIFVVDSYKNPAYSIIDEIAGTGEWDGSKLYDNTYWDYWQPWVEPKEPDTALRLLEKVCNACILEYHNSIMCRVREFLGDKPKS